MKILKKIDWKIIIKNLLKGGLVIFPSDTVYGALVDAKNPKAVNKLIEFKNRPAGKAISIFVSDLQMAKKYVFINDNQLRTLNQLIPGPFTFILPSKRKVDNRLESEKGTLAIRIPQFDPIIELVKKFTSPLTATSANLSGHSPHYSIFSLLNQLPEKKKRLIDLIIDFGKLPRNKPSTVVDLTQETIRFLRYGEIRFLNTETFITNNPKETRKLAQFLLTKFLYLNLNQPLIFILQGELGVGKTIFVKGAGESLGIKDIISPTFVIYHEYEIKFSNISHQKERQNLNQLKKLIHMDLYRIQEEEELKDLPFDELVKPENLIMIEWGEKIASVYNHLKKKGKIIYIKMKYIDEKKRKILVKYD